MHKTLSNNPSLPLYLVLSSSYLALQSTLLLLSPRLVITLLASNSFRPPTTDLETYLCRALAWSLLAISGFGASCAIALARESEGDDVPKKASPPSSAGVTSATALILPVTLLYHTISTIQAYVNYSGLSGSSGFLLHVVASGMLCVYGFWVLVFGSQVRVSSVDGRDKRVSGFLFGGGKKEGKGL